MNIVQKSLVALAVGSLMTVSAQAAMSYGDGTPYIGVKVGQFNVDSSTFDDATAYGVYGGYNFDKNFGVEVEYIGSSDEDLNLPPFTGDYDVKTYGAYGTYRYHFADSGLYAKGKLGFAKTKISASLFSSTLSASDTGIAGGLGLGYDLNPNFGIEAEYAIIDSDIDLLTVGANLKF